MYILPLNIIVAPDLKQQDEICSFFQKHDCQVRLTAKVFTAYLNAHQPRVPCVQFLNFEHKKTYSWYTHKGNHKGYASISLMLAPINLLQKKFWMSMNSSATINWGYDLYVKLEIAAKIIDCRYILIRSPALPSWNYYPELDFIKRRGPAYPNLPRRNHSQPVLTIK